MGKEQRKTAGNIFRRFKASGDKDDHYVSSIETARIPGLRAEQLENLNKEAGGLLIL